jgi:hypothetical protein
MSRTIPSGRPVTGEGNGLNPRKAAALAAPSYRLVPAAANDMMLGERVRLQQAGVGQARLDGTWASLEGNGEFTALEPSR